MKQWQGLVISWPFGICCWQPISNILTQGGLCGGIFIDEAFETICKNRLGRQWNNIPREGVKSILKYQWEYVYKPAYKPTTDGREVVISVPSWAFEDANLNDKRRKPFIINGQIHFSRSRHFHPPPSQRLIDLAPIFKRHLPRFSPISRCSLINKSARRGRKVFQLRSVLTVFIYGLMLKNHQKVILVGGLGCSPYLFSLLSAKCEQHGIEIIQSMGTAP